MPVIILITWTTAFIIGVIFTWLSISISRILRIVDRPGAIKIHDQPMPRMGGIGILAGFLVGILVNLWVTGIQWSSLQPWVVGGFVFTVTGYFDDLRGLQPWKKLLGQLAGSAIFAILFLFGLIAVPYPAWLFVMFVTIVTFLLIFFSNSLNLLDGMDGLAAGISIIIAGGFLVLTIVNSQELVFYITLSLIGGCFGFLFFNYPPAKTFMGDIGSLFLGQALGGIGVAVAITSPVSINRIIGVLIVFMVPITDTTAAILRRLSMNGKVMQGDRLHLYDCLSRHLGGRVKLTIVLMWALTVVTVVAGDLVYLYASTTQTVIVFLCVIILMVYISIKLGIIGFKAQSGYDSSKRLKPPSITG